MRTFKFFWTTHKWTGILLSTLFLLTAGTGFLLLLKKEYAWLQPPTLSGESGGVDAFITNQELFAAVFGAGHEDFTSLDDVDRVDFRPGKRVFKVRSIHNYMEMQIDAVTGSVLGIAPRMSDLLEQLHDGSFFADWVHGYVMPVAALALAFLVFSGLWLWLEPIVKRRRRRRERARQAAAA